MTMATDKADVLAQFSTVLSELKEASADKVAVEQEGRSHLPKANIAARGGSGCRGRVPCR